MVCLFLVLDLCYLSFNMFLTCYWRVLSYFVFCLCLMASCVCFITYVPCFFVLFAFVVFVALCLLPLKLKLGQSGNHALDRFEAKVGGSKKKSTGHTYNKQCGFEAIFFLFDVFVL